MIALVLLTGLLGAIAPLVLALCPRLGLAPLRYLRQWRTVVSLAALLAATLEHTRKPSARTLSVVLASGAFAAAAQVIDPRRVFYALTDPPKVRANVANLGDEALVLGLTSGAVALAWPLELVAPHHLINDRIEDSAVLVSY